MEYRPFGPTKREVSIIGEGTWYFEKSDKDTAISALQRSLDLGINHLDTAELYGNGEAEKIIGESIGVRRNQVFLVSKVYPGHASKKGTIKACEGSLSRLRTDHIDCYLLHWRGRYPLEETIEAFEELKREGKILSWGVSNFGVNDLDQVLKIAGKDRLACNQVLYHLKDRSIEQEVIPWCEKHGVAVTAYSPFGHGDFPSSRTKEGKVLEEIAKAHNATPRQVALSFLARRQSVFAIPKASSPEHVVENAGAAYIRLTKDEIDRIDEAFPIGPSPGFPPW
ncbi:MAG TPA: aldo/keto reductase [Nitrososphaerales archaeon]|nr:aldo/keto reductase [Nitrososphaerales archaeon]